MLFIVVIVPSDRKVLPVFSVSDLENLMAGAQSDFGSLMEHYLSYFSVSIVVRKVKKGWLMLYVKDSD